MKGYKKTWRRSQLWWRSEEENMITSTQKMLLAALTPKSFHLWIFAYIFRICGAGWLELLWHSLSTFGLILIFVKICKYFQHRYVNITAGVPWPSIACSIFIWIQIVFKQARRCASSKLCRPINLICGRHKSYWRGSKTTRVLLLVMFWASPNKS